MQIKWPNGCKSAAMFTFDLDGDIIWQNMSADEPHADQLIRCLLYTSVSKRPPGRQPILFSVS